MREATLDVLHDAVVGGVRFGVVECGDVLVGLDLPGTDSHDQRVVVDAPSLTRMDDLGVAVDPCERVLRPVGIAVMCDAAQRIALWRPECERLAHRHRPVDQFLFGSDQLEVQRVPRQSPKPEESLHAGDAAAAHHHPKITHAQTVRLTRSPAIGAPDRTVPRGAHPQQVRSRAWPGSPPR